MAPPADPVVVRRGDIWWVSLDPTQGGEIRKTRPAVVITVNALNRARRTVVAVPLSTGPEPRPPIVVATPSAGPNSVAVCDQLRLWISGVSPAFRVGFRSRICASSKTGSGEFWNSEFVQLLDVAALQFFPSAAAEVFVEVDDFGALLKAEQNVEVGALAAIERDRLLDVV